MDRPNLEELQQFSSHPHVAPLAQYVLHLEAQVAALTDALKEQHEWHLAQDDYVMYLGDGKTCEMNPRASYEESVMCDITVAALGNTELADDRYTASIRHDERRKVLEELERRGNEIACSDYSSKWPLGEAITAWAQRELAALDDLAPAGDGHPHNLQKG